MKKLIVDIDGVLADTVTPALAWFNYQHGTCYLPTDIDHYNPDLLTGDGIISFADWMVAHLKDPDFHREVKALPGSRLVLEDAMLDQWEITLATARAPDAEVLTSQWLEWNQIPYDILVHQPEKHLLTGDLLIEDNLDNVLQWNGWFTGPSYLRAALLVNTTYNQAAWLPWPIKRVRDWVDIDIYLRDPEEQDGLRV